MRAVAEPVEKLPEGQAVRREPNMTATDKVFAGSIPEVYDRYLVPLIFEPYAEDLARRAAHLKPASVLEIAAGTGALTRALVSALPSVTELYATDLNQPMLDQAKARMFATDRVIWKQADALALPFADGSFDLVACQFGVMFFPDKVRGYSEARRVLKSEGHFLFNVWDRIEGNDFADVVTASLAEQFPGDPPRFMARTPHGYCDVTRIREEVRAAGFSNVTIAAVDHLSKARSSHDPAVAYCQGTPLRNEIEARDPTGLQKATEQAAAALTKKFGKGPVEGRIRAFAVDAY